MSYQDYEILKRKIDLLPDEPGCYLMKNGEGKIIYVGKAKSLIKRVKQYFTRPQEGKVFRMVQEIRDFDIIRTDSEKEALLLEINLIQKYYPKFNILLKDGKMYPYIAISKSQDPYLKITHSDKDKRYWYFGPYPNGGSAYKMMLLLNKIYPVRKCKTIPSKPCLYYHLGECLGPCINKVDPKDYQEMMSHMKRFLEGDVASVKKDIKGKMLEASNNLNFELAAEYKKLLSSIDHIASEQKIMMKDHIDRDVVGYSLREGYVSIAFLLYRRGVLLGKKIYIIEDQNDIEEELSTVIMQFYEMHPKPKELLISFKNLTNILGEALGISVKIPVRGLKKDLLFLAFENAKKGLDEHFQTARLEDNNLQLLEELGSLLNMEAPLDIELFDNSHLQGEGAIGAMVKYINGVRVPNQNRRYNIRGDNHRDDLEMMKEVLTRRVERLLNDEAKLPDLFLVDGGLNQVRVANEVVAGYGVNIRVAGLYKNAKHVTEGLVDGLTENIIPIDSKSPLFFFLMRMQDEVHRFAITTHRKKRGKSLFLDVFKNIKGIGQKRRAQLLDAYPTIESLFSAKREELEQFIPKDSAEELLKEIQAIKNKQNQSQSID